MCHPAQPSAFPVIAASAIRTPERARESLIDAFGNRLRRVDSFPGFGGLQVWEDERDPERFLMVSWWSSSEALRAYLTSADHRASHARIPGGPDRPRPDGLSRYRIVAT